jgi:hypothetical protein
LGVLSPFEFEVEEVGDACSEAFKFAERWGEFSSDMFEDGGS